MSYQYSWKTHFISDCFDDSCEECERYYCLEIHPDVCDNFCERPCWLCYCNGCIEERTKLTACI